MPTKTIHIQVKNGGAFIGETLIMDAGKGSVSANPDLFSAITDQIRTDPGINDGDQFMLEGALIGECSRRRLILHVG